MRCAKRARLFLAALILLPSGAVRTEPREAAAHPQFHIIALNPMGASSRAAVSINSRDQVVGTYSVPTSDAHAVLAQPGKFKDLGTLGGKESNANAINELGQVAGSSILSDGHNGHAFLWDPGRGMMDLGALGNGSEGLGLNNLGDVVGRTGSRGFIWINGFMMDIGDLGGQGVSAQAINDKREIVGTSPTAHGDSHAFLWKDGQMTDLGTLGGSSSGASAINLKSQVVGSSTTASGDQHAFLWENGHMSDLGTLGGRSSNAQGINDAGRICGFSLTATGQFHAFIWENGLMTDLGTAEGDESEAYGINASGHIAGNISGLPDAFTFHPVIWSAAKGSLSAF